jgi:hypothetical protein
MLKNTESDLPTQTAKLKKNEVLKLEVQNAVSEARNTFASTTTLITSSLTLVAGLAWNDVAKAIFEKLKVHLSGWGETIGLVLYAIIVTVIVVLVVQRLKKIQKVVGGKSIK